VRVRIAAGLAAAGAVASLGAGVALAAPTWKAPMTVAEVRGIPDPQVAVDRAGTATVVYSTADVGSTSRRPTVYAAARLPGQGFGKPTALGIGAEPRIAVDPGGATAIAWIDGDRIQFLLQPAPGQLGAPGQLRTAIDVAGGGARDLRLLLDGAGRATLAWLPDAASDVGREVRPRSATISPQGELSPVQELGAPTQCGRLQLAGNAAGDAAAACFPGTTVHVREAGAGEFVTETYAPNYLHSQAYLSVDGAGTVTVALPSDSSGHMALALVERSRGGAFAQTGAFTDADGASIPRLFAQEGRSVVAWTKGGELHYAIRPAGGAFGTKQTLATAGRSMPSAFVDVRAPLGPLPLIMATTEVAFGDVAPLNLRGATVGVEGVARLAGGAVVPGLVDFPGNVAASESGIAVATWEQRCGEGFAVMAMALDERRGTSEPPCQDRAAPKVLIRPRQARLVGRALRFRAGCDEVCRLLVRTRVVRAGVGKPLATKKARRAVPIGAGRFRSFALRLRPAEVARVRASLAARRRVTVRFALSVRDAYENGAVRRVAVPLRR
jgi:hypothetical protein